MNEFDNLYNEFFKGRGNKPDQSSGMEKMIKMVEDLNLGAFGSINPDETELGVPTTRRIYEEDGVKFEECTWDTDFGTIVRVATIDDIEFEKDWFKENGIPTGKIMKIDESELSLEERLMIAQDVEDYETCADLRDEIKALAEEKVAGELKNNKGIPKKDKKDEASENLDNKGLPDEGEWNF